MINLIQCFLHLDKLWFISLLNLKLAEISFISVPKILTLAYWG